MLSVDWWEKKVKKSDNFDKNRVLIKNSKFINTYFDIKNFLRWKIVNKIIKLIKYFALKLTKLSIKK